MFCTFLNALEVTEKSQLVHGDRWVVKSVDVLESSGSCNTDLFFLGLRIIPRLVFKTRWEGKELSLEENELCKIFPIKNKLDYGEVGT